MQAYFHSLVESSPVETPEAEVFLEYFMPICLRTLLLELSNELFINFAGDMGYLFLSTDSRVHYFWKMFL